MHNDNQLLTQTGNTITNKMNHVQLSVYLMIKYTANRVKFL